MSTPTEAKHTPGTWSAGAIDGSCVYAGRIATKGTCVADCNTGHLISTDEIKANARLIAAAPDLLEACEAMVIAQGWPEDDERERWFEVWNSVHAAIAKAKKELANNG